GPGAAHGPGPAHLDARHPGVALLLLQEPDDPPGPVSRARPVHPAHEAEEHAALPARRGPDHPPGRRVLRLMRRALGIGIGLGVVLAALPIYRYREAAARPVKKGKLLAHAGPPGKPPVLDLQRFDLLEGRAYIEVDGTSRAPDPRNFAFEDDRKR